jgi:hypothetical protein
MDFVQLLMLTTIEIEAVGTQSILYRQVKVLNH